MNDNIKTPDNTNDGKNKKDNPDGLIPPKNRINNGEDKAKTSNNKEDEKQQKVNNNMKHRIFFTNRRIQLGLMIINIFMLLFFIGFGYWQGTLTRRAVEKSDSSFSYTKYADSINGVRDSKSFAYTKYSDSVNRSYNERSFNWTKRSDSLNLDNAKRTNAFNAKITKIQTRAYIAVTEITFSTFRINKSILTKVLMENMGKTPAFKVWITNAIKLGVSEINMSDFEIINQTKNVGDSINMNAGSEYSYEALSTQRGAVSIIDSVNIKTGKKAFYCLGIIKYIDIFGDKRFTRYCFKYDPGTGIFRSYGSYNNAN